MCQLPFLKSLFDQLRFAFLLGGADHRVEFLPQGIRLIGTFLHGVQSRGHGFIRLIVCDTKAFAQGGNDIGFRLDRSSCTLECAFFIILPGQYDLVPDRLPEQTPKRAFDRILKTFQFNGVPPDIQIGRAHV